jgi:hypothetical protein
LKGRKGIKDEKKNIQAFLERPNYIIQFALSVCQDFTIKIIQGKRIDLIKPWSLVILVSPGILH